MQQGSNYSPELRERAMRLVLDQQSEHDSQWAAIITSAIGWRRFWTKKSTLWLAGSGIRAARKNAMTIGMPMRLGYL